MWKEIGKPSVVNKNSLQVRACKLSLIFYKEISCCGNAIALNMTHVPKQFGNKCVTHPPKVVSKLIIKITLQLLYKPT